MNEAERKAILSAVAATHTRESQEKDCPQCGTTTNKLSRFCPSCEASLVDVPTANYTRKGKSQAPKCPACSVGTMQAMNAVARGKALASGKLITAFSKSHRCDSCGHLA